MDLIGSHTSLRAMKELAQDNTSLQREMERYRALYTRTREAYEYLAKICDEAHLMNPTHTKELKRILTGGQAGQ
jgi:hypothetical protein